MRLHTWASFTFTLKLTFYVDRDRAFRTLQEALRSNYDNWRMWENFLVVSALCCKAAST